MSIKNSKKQCWLVKWFFSKEPLIKKVPPTDKIIYAVVFGTVFYGLINYVIYAVNKSNPHQDCLSTSDASAAYASGVFSAISLVLLVINFYVANIDSKKKDYQFISQQFSLIFNKRFALYKSLIGNLEGEINLSDNSNLKNIKTFSGTSLLDKKLQQLPLNSSFLVKDKDSEGNIIEYLNLDSVEFDNFNEPCYELMSLLCDTIYSNNICNEEKEKYYSRLRNLSKVELIWFLIFCVSNVNIKDNLSLLNKSKILTKLPSPYDLSYKSDNYFLLMEFLKDNELIYKNLFDK